MNRLKREFAEGASIVGSKYVELEDFVPYRVYAITYSPTKQPGDCLVRSLSTFHFYLIKEFESLKLKATYVLMPEFGQNNRLHYHGLISFSTCLDYLKFKHHFENEHVVIKRIFGRPKIWYDYMTKQWKHLKDILPCPFTNNRCLLLDYYEQMVWCRIDPLLDDPC